VVPGTKHFSLQFTVLQPSSFANALPPVAMDLVIGALCTASQWATLWPAHHRVHVRIHNGGMLLIHLLLSLKQQVFLIVQCNTAANRQVCWKPSWIFFCVQKSGQAIAGAWRCIWIGFKDGLEKTLLSFPNACSEHPRLRAKRTVNGEVQENT